MKTQLTPSAETPATDRAKKTTGQMERLANKREALQFSNEHWAVFNNHVNNAGKRALHICNLRFATVDGDGLGGLKALNKADREGIMAIFDVKPTPAATLYASLVFVFANGLDKTIEKTIAKVEGRIS